MIKSFGDTNTRKIYHREGVRKLPSRIRQRAHLKLIQIDEANELNQLRVPPSNRLEKLKGSLSSHYSIRINQQWRIIFIWNNNHPEDVTISEYH